MFINNNPIPNTGNIQNDVDTILNDFNQDYNNFLNSCSSNTPDYSAFGIVANTPGFDGSDLGFFTQY